MGILRPSLSLPVAAYNHPWDGRLARERVLDFCKSEVGASPTEKNIDVPCARRAFLLTRDGEPNYTREHWDLPYADIVDGALMIIPRGVKALASGHGVIAVTKISESERKILKRYTCELYDRVRRRNPQMPECPFNPGEARAERAPINASGQEATMNPLVITVPSSPGRSVEFRDIEGNLIASISAAMPDFLKKGDDKEEEDDEDKCPECDKGDDECAEKRKKCLDAKKEDADDDDEPTSYSASIVTEDQSTKVIGRYKVPLHPPRDWFEPQQTSGPVPLTIQADGRVYGHGATWDSCHAGFTDRCVPVPRSVQDYKHFHRGGVMTADGAVMAVGHLTVGAGHAVPTLGLKAAAEHYDDASSTVAVVAAYEDRWGIYLAGSLVADTDPEKIAMLLRSPLSGDWRQTDGNLELVAMHGVNVPGFGVDRPRAMAASGGLIIFDCTNCVSEPEEIEQRIALAASALQGKE